MKSTIMKFAAASAAAVLGLLAFTSDAGAVNLNQHGSACTAFNFGQANDLDQLFSGVRTLATSPRAVICPVTHSPSSTGATSASYFVDGANSGGATTFFTLESLNFDGTFQSSVSFSSNLAKYDLFETLTSVSTFSYVSLLATLPASGNGVFLGVTSIQP